MCPYRHTNLVASIILIGRMRRPILTIQRQRRHYRPMNPRLRSALPACLSSFTQTVFSACRSAINRAASCCKNPTSSLARMAAVLGLAILTPSSALALNPGNLVFTALNGDEDGWAMAALVDIPANTTIFFSDNEWDTVALPLAFNTGESFSQWLSGSAPIPAGTVIRFSAVDSSTLLASSIGTFSRVTVSGSASWGLALPRKLSMPMKDRQPHPPPDSSPRSPMLDRSTIRTGRLRTQA